MSVDTLSFVVLSQIERAKHSFVMEEIEVVVKFVIVEKLDLDILFIMSKRAEEPIFACIEVPRIMRTELRFVFVRLIQLLHAIVAFGAIISIRAGHPIILFGVLA